MEGQNVNKPRILKISYVYLAEVSFLTDLVSDKALEQITNQMAGKLSGLVIALRLWGRRFKSEQSLIIFNKFIGILITNPF